MNKPYTPNSISLKNGLKIHCLPFPNIKSVYLHAWVFVGSANEDKVNNGISHFLEHMMFRGNRKLGSTKELNLKMEELGGEMNAATSFDTTEYWMKVHVDFLEEGIRRFCRLLRFPLFEDIELERSVIMEEIMAEYNEENSLINADTLTSKILWPDHPMGFSIIGEPETVKSISKEFLKDWFETYYGPGNMILGVAGDINNIQVETIIDEELGDQDPSPRYHYPQTKTQPKKGTQIDLVDDKDNQFQLLWTFPFHEISPRLRTCYQIINRLLDDGSSSLLQRLIREEKGLVYDISASITFLDTGGVFSIQVVVSLNRFEELINELTDLIETIGNTGFLQEDFELAQTRYGASLDFFTDSPQGQLYEKTGEDIYPCFQPFNETKKDLESIDLQEINQTLKNLLIQTQTSFVGIGPWSDEFRLTIKNKLSNWIVKD